MSTKITDTTIAKTYRLPRVMAACILDKSVKKIFGLPRPSTHKDVVEFMLKQGGYETVLASNNLVFGFILETGAFADRLMAAECAAENNQVLTGADLTLGLYCEHLVQ